MKLYCIIDKNTVRHASLEKSAHDLFRMGAHLVQLRWKNSPSDKLVSIGKTIQRLAKKYKKILLINDRIDVALACGAGGVHLGNGDLPPKTARRLLSRKNIVGKTVHSVREAKKARLEKIDYIGAGPLFPTPLKKNLAAKGLGFIKKIKKYISVPLFAIGGIDERNINLVLKTGADGICVARAASKARNLLKTIQNAADNN